MTNQSAEPTPPRPPVTYREVLSPSLPVWLVALAVSASLGLPVLPVLGGLGSAVVALAASTVAGAALWRTSPTIEVHRGELRAGPARIPVTLLGRVSVVSARRMTGLRGPDGDARAFMCQRGWLPGGVLVEVLDVADPVPYWLLSSRSPQRLADALVRSGALAADELA